MWLDTTGEMERRGTSLQNPTEVAVIQRLVTLLLKRGFKATDITIVSMYLSQKSLLQSTIVPDLKIKTCDSMLGQQSPIIIISMTRCSPETNTIGFLSDLRRLNVALTRAQLGMFVVGWMSADVSNTRSVP